MLDVVSVQWSPKDFDLVLQESMDRLLERANVLPERPTMLPPKSKQKSSIVEDSINRTDEDAPTSNVIAASVDAAPPPVDTAPEANNDPDESNSVPEAKEEAVEAAEVAEA